MEWLGFSLLTFVPACSGATWNLGLCSWTVSGPCPFRSHLFINPPGTRFIRLISLIKAAVTWREREPWARQLGHLSNPHPLNALSIWVYAPLLPLLLTHPSPLLPTSLFTCLIIISFFEACYVRRSQTWQAVLLWSFPQDIYPFV